MIATPAYFMTAGPFPECPRRGAPWFWREGSTPHGRDATRLGSQEPGAAQPHAPGEAVNDVGERDANDTTGQTRFRDETKHDHVVAPLEPRQQAS